MSKYVRRSSYSRACKKAKSVGHFKTSFGGKHVRVTVGTKGIHTSVKVGNITYKPGSGNYSVRGKYGTYYGNVNSSNKSSGAHIEKNAYSKVYYSNVQANPEYHSIYEYYDETAIKLDNALDTTFNAIKTKEYYKFIMPFIGYILIPLIMIAVSLYQ